MQRSYTWSYFLTLLCVACQSKLKLQSFENRQQVTQHP